MSGPGYMDDAEPPALSVLARRIGQQSYSSVLQYDASSIMLRLMLVTDAVQTKSFIDG